MACCTYGALLLGDDPAPQCHQVTELPRVQPHVAALAQPVAEAQTYVQQQPAANLDETGWREQSRRAWLWVCATPQVVVFLVLATRGAQGAKTLLGEAFPGITGSDRWSAYNWLAPQRRQLCWAHLKRDLQKLVERGGNSARLGQALLEQAQELFRLWGGARGAKLPSLLPNS